MEEVSKIIRVIKPDMKIFVGDSLAGNDTVNQAREFFEYTKYDGSILTKSDADSKGGAAISIAYLTHKPILYLGMGQGYGDLEEFDHDRFLDSIFKDKVYNKTEKIQAPADVLADDHIGKVEPQTDVSYITESDSIPIDASKLGSSFDDADKKVEKAGEEKELTVPQTIEVAPAQIDEVKYDYDQNNAAEEKMQSKMESVTEITEPKPKGGSFFKKIFKDTKDKRETDDGKVNRNVITDRNNITETKKETIKKENKDKVKKSKSGPRRESEKDNDEVVYLTDDDINDLIK
jgi:fused signal recognition particle receptor